MDAHAHQSACSPSATSLLPLYSYKLMHHTSADSLAGPQSFDMSGASLPPDHGSLDIEMFAPPTGVVTLSSVNQFVLSSGPPTAMQLDTALARWQGCPSNRQKWSSFWSVTAQTLVRRLTHDFIQLSHKEVQFHMGVQATGYEKATSGCTWPIVLQHTTW